MPNKKQLVALVGVLIIGIAYFFKENRTNEAAIPTKTTDYTKPKGTFDFLPTSTTGQVIHHKGYSLSYSEAHEQAEWVAHTLSEKDIVYTKYKRPYFIYDPKVRTKSADWKNYKKSGYDKGHLCPAGDRKQSKAIYNETFYTSNISPQRHDFNSGIWNTLEQKTRYWAGKYKQLYVITGGVLTSSGLKTIGREDVSVPKAFYKILLDYTEPEIKAIAFLMPHEESNKPLYEFVVSIDEIEKQTGIDFFPNLPDNIEDKLEQNTSYKQWSFR